MPVGQQFFSTMWYVRPAALATCPGFTPMGGIQQPCYPKRYWVNLEGLWVDISPYHCLQKTDLLFVPFFWLTRCNNRLRPNTADICIVRPVQMFGSKLDKYGNSLVFLIPESWLLLGVVGRCTVNIEEKTMNPFLKFVKVIYCTQVELIIGPNRLNQKRQEAMRITREG